MNIYVGNLSWSIRENDLRKVMERYGEVEFCKIIIDLETGKSKGFAFVEMKDQQAGRRAVEELNGVELEGRPLVIIDATPKSDGVTELEKAIQFVMLGKLYFSNHQNNSDGYLGQTCPVKLDEDLFPQWY